MADDYDVIVLGAGHNGLILQAYLCKAGLRVLAVDRAQTAGGGLATVEDPRHPGIFHNTHAFFQRAVTAMPWYGDLALARHGAHYIEPELNVVLLTRDAAASNGGPISNARRSRSRISAGATRQRCAAGTRNSRRLLRRFCVRKHRLRRCRPTSDARSCPAAPPAGGCLR